ncbi:MAG: VWA domain-containing protein [Oscillospiraceae bacterium]|nr:VWA domain-containing protein [Oscillospiraceae bacterium]
MKRLDHARRAALLLALCMLLALAGCGNVVTTPDPGKPTAEAETTDPNSPAANATATDGPTGGPDAPGAETGEPDAPIPAATAAPGDGSGLYVESTGGTGAGGEGELLAESAIAPSAVGGYGVEFSTSMKSGDTAYAAEGGGAAREPGEAPVPGATDGGDLSADPAIPGDGETPDAEPEPWPVEPEPGEAYVLTAAEWNDNDNWPFFTNLVNAGTIDFPSFGIDPRNRMKVTLLDADGAPLDGETVELLDDAGASLWTAKTDKNGAAYLFWHEGETPAAVPRGDALYPVTLRTAPSEDRQGAPVVIGAEDLVIHAEPEAPAKKLLQVMFIVDTTGSMSDELSYLQMDFSAIAGELDGHGIEWSACFYRDEGDEYVTRVSEFSGDVSAIQNLLASEYAAGGGDTPEAVAEILDETLTMDFVQDHGRRGWQEDAEKVAFLIFDAPPHYGVDATIDAAVRRAAAAGIRVIPVVASNADRETELFGRALAICTGGTYVFLTDDSGVGNSHLEPIVGPYAVEKLHDVIVRILSEHLI